MTGNIGETLALARAAGMSDEVISIEEANRRASASVLVREDISRLLGKVTKLAEDVSHHELRGLLGKHDREFDRRRDDRQRDEIAQFIEDMTARIDDAIAGKSYYKQVTEAMRREAEEKGKP